VNVLVVGGLGFVGSEICRYWNKYSDVDLIVLDNQSKGTLENIKGVDFQYLPVDIADCKAVQLAFAEVRPEIVLHLAAMHFIPDCNRDPAQCLTTNIIGTENVLQACAQTNSVRKVIATSSQAVYPIKDSPNKEEDLPFPCDVYGESKLANEYQSIRFQRETGIDTIVVRLANVYGPRETNPHVIPEIMNQLAEGKQQILLGNIDPERDFINTADVASAYIALALHPNAAGFHIVNLGSGQGYSIRNILTKLSRILGKEITYERDTSRFRTTERMYLVADIGRIYNLVGWCPQVSIDQGLQELCQWYNLDKILLEK